MGLVHLYCGDGKGKTTAAIGLALRCVGGGGKVLIYQFLKDGSSGEIKVLKQIRGIHIIEPESDITFVSRMSEEKKKELKLTYSNRIEDIDKQLAVDDKEKPYDMVILDEVTHAVNHGFVELSSLINFITKNRENVEIVMTGRNPENQLTEIADYVSDVNCVKHPYNKGIPARKLIEY